MTTVIHDLALATGYVVLSVIAVLLILRLAFNGLSIWFWRGSSDKAKQMGAHLQNEKGYDAGASALLFDMVQESIEDLGSDAHIRYAPTPVATVDWSIDNPGSTEVNVMKTALSDAGYYIHPFPQERNGEWSQSHVGVWKREPTWYLEEEDVRREVTPDTHEWTGRQSTNNAFDVHGANTE